MPAQRGRHNAARVAPALFVALGALLATAGCARDGLPASRCPRVAIVADAADLARYHGAGRDLTDLVLEGRIAGVAGRCTAHGTDSVRIEVAPRVDLSSGPAATVRDADIPVFAAAVRDGTILDEKVATLHARLPRGGQARIFGEAMQLDVPSPARGEAQAGIEVGFRLTPEELATNRAGPTRPRTGMR